MLSRQTFGLVIGLLVFALLLVIPTPDGMTFKTQAVAAVTCLMAIWWMTEAIPIPATSLLPIVLFPALGVVGTKQVTMQYGHHLVYLMLGGFIIAQAIERWGLHRRIALNTINILGLKPSRMLLGFMVATAMLSMWISNAATTLMMMPIAAAVIFQLKQSNKNYHPAFGTALLLAIAYSASIGGTGTLIGTPPNVVLAAQMEALHEVSISFLDWMLLAAPLLIVMLLVVWVLFTKIIFKQGMQLKGTGSVIKQELNALGHMTAAERRVLLVFVLVGLAWVLRGSLKLPELKGITDASIAVLGALLLFLLPSGMPKTGQSERLMDWDTARNLPWSTLLLFGGGLALAFGFKTSGLDVWLGNELSFIKGMDLIWVVAIIVAVVILLTEITSNTATATVFIPIMSAVAMSSGYDPMITMIATTLAASYAFMLPVATPPNTIVFGSGQVEITDMVRAGLWLNLIGSVLITLVVYYWLPHVF